MNAFLTTNLSIRVLTIWASTRSTYDVKEKLNKYCSHKLQMSVVDQATRREADQSPTPPGTQPANGRRTPNAANQANHGGNRTGFKKTNNGRFIGNNKTSFKGETAGLNGAVFQLQDESKDPTQFNRTIEAIERYSNKTFDLDLSVLFDKMELPEVEKPVKPTGDEVDNVDVDIYREKVKLYAKEEKSMVKTMRALYAIVWGQCSQNVVTKLNQCKDEKTWRTNGDCAKLLQTIKEIVLKYDQQKNEYLTLFRQVRYFMTYRQREQQDLHRYFEVFQLMTDTIDHLGGSFVHPGYVTKLKDDDEVSDADRESMDDEDSREYDDKAKDRFLALTFLSGARTDQYGDLLIELENDSLKGYDNFPCTVVEAYHMLANYATKRRNYVPHQKRQVKSNAVVFLQNGVEPNGSPVPGTDGIIHAHIKCYACKKQGHYSNKCPHSMLQHFAPASPDDVSEWAGSDKKDNVDEERGSLGFGLLSFV